MEPTDNTPATTTVRQPVKKHGIAHRLYTGDISYDFVGKKKFWYIVSGILLALALGGLLFRGLSLGIEFKGGSVFQAPAKISATTVGDFRDAVQALGLQHMDDTVVTTVGGKEVRVQTRSLTVHEVGQVTDAIAAKAGIAKKDVNSQLIGPSWGKQITQQGLIALIVFLALVALLMGIYFREWKMSIAALVALMHDLVLTVGIYALTGFSVTPATLIGVLTILGYSLYDTVVVFDKVRENTHDLTRGSHTYSFRANKALNQVLVRSLNTTVIGVLPVVAILIAGLLLGGGPLRDLGLALFIGMIVGAYSSVFIATPVLAQMKEAEPEMKEFRARLARRKSRHGDSSDIDAEAPASAEATEPRASDIVATMNTGEASKRPLVIGSSGRAQPSRSARSQRKKS